MSPKVTLSVYLIITRIIRVGVLVILILRKILILIKVIKSMRQDLSLLSYITLTSTCSDFTSPPLMWSHVATFSTVSGITLAQLNSSRSQVLVRVTWPPCLTPQPPPLSTSNTKLPVEPLQGCLFSSFHVEMGLHLGMYLGRQFSRVHLASLGLRSSYVLFTITATSCRSTHSRCAVLLDLKKNVACWRAAS